MTFIRWTTHAPLGLSEKDVLMAQYCDEQALACGEVVVAEGAEPALQEGDTGRELADLIATEGAECCVPKKKQTPAV
jgi:4a-hydroxytetrahydrobiopterin dehydratase